MKRFLAVGICGLALGLVLAACGGPQHIVISFATPPTTAAPHPPPPTCSAGLGYYGGAESYSGEAAGVAGGPWEWVITVPAGTTLTGSISWTLHWQGGADPVGKWIGSTPPAGSDAAPGGTFSYTGGSSPTLTAKVPESGPAPPIAFEPDWGDVLITAANSSGQTATCRSGLS